MVKEKYKVHVNPGMDERWGVRGSPQANQEARVEKLSEQVVDRLQLYVEGKKKEFEAWASTEVESLATACETPVPLCHCACTVIAGMFHADIPVALLYFYFILFIFSGGGGRFWRKMYSSRDDDMKCQVATPRVAK